MRRYYKQGSTWLMRVDGNPTATQAESIAHCEAEYGLTGVTAVDIEDDRNPRDAGPYILPPPVPLPPPSRQEQALATIREIDTSAIADRATREAFVALRDAILDF